MEKKQDTIVRVERHLVAYKEEAERQPATLFSIRRTQDGMLYEINLFGRDDGGLLLDCMDVKENSFDGLGTAVESQGWLKRSPLAREIRELGSRILGNEKSAYATKEQTVEINNLLERAYASGITMKTVSGSHPASCVKKVGPVI